MPDSQVLGNTIESCNYILAYATTTHRKMTNDGSQDASVRPSKESTFNATIPQVSGTITCFNCGQAGHRVNKCPKPTNQPLIDKNVAAFKERMKASRAVSGSVPGAPTVTAPGTSIWKAPSPEEHGRRVIGGNPFLWNPATHRWDRIKNESAAATTAAITAANLLTTNQAAAAAAAASIAATAAAAAAGFPPTVPPVIGGSANVNANDDSASRTSGVTTEEVGQLQLNIATITRRLADIQDQL